MFPLPIAAAVYCFLLGAVFLALCLWYDHRDRERFKRESRKSTFHCIRCDELYAAPGAPELCACPRCGHRNARLRF
ncbi:MAG: hydrogenase nickel incorporation protein HypA [Opitutaceae bacterium]